MKRILVVDDEFDISEAISAVLEAEGYTVEIRSDGGKALRLLGELAVAPTDSPHRPNLILLDVMMPFAGGFEVLRYIRDQKNLADLPVVMMSAVAPAVSPKEIPYQAFLQKPFTLDDLVKVVAKNL